MNSNGFSNPVFYEDGDIYEKTFLFAEEDSIEHDTISQFDDDSLFDFDSADFEGWGRSRKKLQGLNKWRNGPMPIETFNKEIEKPPEIGSLEWKESDNTKIKISSLKAADRSLLKYFKEIAENKEAEFDYIFVNNALKISDINMADVYGQTLMHEIAREWDIDIARFLRIQGIDMDKPDEYGRTPLFVAVASDHFEMVNFLIECGANIYRKCKRGQMSIHYAAFFNSVNSIQILINAAVHPDSRDDEQQTPLFIAAKRGNTQVCNYLLSIEVPTASYTIHGSTATEQIILNCSHSLALKCLNQYIVYEKQTSNARYYLSQFTKKRWKRLSKLKGLVCEDEIYPNSLEIIVEKNEHDLIMHPIITMLLATMMDRFGAMYLYGNILLNLLFTICWTIAASLQKMNEEPSGTRLAFIIGFGGIGFFLAILFVIKIFYEHRATTRKQENRRMWYIDNLKEKRSQCHPRWIPERNTFDKEIETSLINQNSFWSDTWVVLDLLSLLATFIYAGVETGCLFGSKDSQVCTVRGYYSVPFLILTWVRLNRSLQILESMGQFISCFSHCFTATLQFGFLYAEFFLPLFCAFWVMFGGPREENKDDSEYRSANDMIYQLYLLTIVGDYEYEKLKEINETFAQILVGAFLLLISCVCLNLYIALLSEAFVRVHSFATATARINQAKALLSIGYVFPSTLNDFEKYLMKECAPKIQNLRTPKNQSEPADVLEMLKKLLNTMNAINSEAGNVAKDTDSVLATHQQLMNELQSFESRYSGDISETLIEDLFNVIDDNNLKFFKMQRKAKEKLSTLQGRAVIEIPAILRQFKEDVKKLLHLRVTKMARKTVEKYEGI